MAEFLQKVVDLMEENQKQDAIAQHQKRDLIALRQAEKQLLNQPQFGVDMTQEATSRGIQIVWAGPDDGPWECNVNVFHEMHMCDTNVKSAKELLDEIITPAIKPDGLVITAYLRKHTPFSGCCDYLLYYDLNREPEEHARVKRQKHDPYDSLRTGIEMEAKARGIDVGWCSEESTVVFTGHVDTHQSCVLWNKETILLPKLPKDILDPIPFHAKMQLCMHRLTHRVYYAFPV